jgi:hypothetical protein
MLAKHGALAPYAVSINEAGAIGVVAAQPESEQSTTVDVLATLYDGLRAQSAGLRAVGVACDVRLRGSGDDAIQVEVEHREGLAIAVVLPYKKKRFGGGIGYGNMSARPGQRRIWLPTN